MFPRDLGVWTSTAYPFRGFHVHVYIAPAQGNFLARVNHTVHGVHSISERSPGMFTVKRRAANSFTIVTVVVEFLVIRGWK